MMRLGFQHWRHWLALTTIVWAALMCCCPTAKAATKKLASCCETKAESHCPASKNGTTTCQFIQLRQSMAPAPAIDQIDAPQICFLAEPVSTIETSPTLVLHDAAIWATPPPPLETLLDLHCSLIC